MYRPMSLYLSHSVVVLTQTMVSDCKTRKQLDLHPFDMTWRLFLTSNLPLLKSTVNVTVTLNINSLSLT